MSALNQIRCQLPRKGLTLSVDIALPATGITVLYGPSGSGKSSLLRCVAGLEKPHEAFIQMGGMLWQDDAQKIFLPTWRRSVGYVFQEPSLFEHLSIRQNLAYGIQRNPSPGGDAARAEAIACLGIESLLDRQPASLSGGERQRVAIARALATQPKVLLLDEPLSALDPARRQEVLPWLERLRDTLRIPMLYVTHSAPELMRLADHLIILENGQIRAQGPAVEVLSQINPPVLTGEDIGTLLHATITERDPQWHLAAASFPGGQVWIQDEGRALGAPVRLRVLARDVSLTRHPPQQSSIQNLISGRILGWAATPHPAHVLVQVRCDTTLLVARLTQKSLASLELQPDMPVWVQIKSVALIQ